VTAEQPNAWCFGCNIPATVAPGEHERRCGGAGCNGRVRRVANQAALETGLLAHRMAQGHYVRSAAIAIAAHPDARTLSPSTQSGNPMPVGRVVRKDGTFHTFDFNHYLDQARTNPLMASDLSRVWIGGAYLVVGDALVRHRYFDRAPELELIRHVRNGIGHGNRFRIDDPSKLARFPAHNRLAKVRGGAVLEIAAHLQGREVLFDFAGPADLLDVLMSVEIYLKRMGVGDPPRG
jgi:hypothetical protein